MTEATAHRKHPAAKRCGHLGLARHRVSSNPVAVRGALASTGRPRVRRTLGALMIASMLALLLAAPAQAAPTLQLPYAKGAAWWVNGPHGTPTYPTRSSVDMGPGGTSPAQVLAAADGVASVGSCSGGGKYVTIDHGGGWSTRYWHLGSTTNIHGKRVSVGDAIGTTSTKCGSYPGFAHVHFSLLKDGRHHPIDGLSIGGYTVHNAPGNYYGYWTRDSDGKEVHRTTNGNAQCCLPNNQSTGGGGGSEPPKGHFDELSSPPGGVRVRGWAFDPDDKRRSLKVHVYVGGPAGTNGAINTGVMANTSRPDVHRAHPGVGDNHGFDSTFETLKRGRQEVCVYAINIPDGSNPKLGCRVVSIADPDPKGKLEAATSPAGGRVSVRGWTFDPNDTRSSLKVHVYVGGPAGANGAINTGVMANKPRPDVNKAYPGVGENHGYDATFETPKRGKQQVCAYGIDVGFGMNKLLGCRDVVIAAPPPPSASPPSASPPSASPPAANPPADARNPRIRLSRRLTRRRFVRSGVRVRLMGLTPGSRVMVRLRARIKGPRIVAKGRGRVRTVGRKRSTISANGKRTLRVRLNRKGRRAVRRAAKGRRMTVRITVRRPAQPTQRFTKHIRLR